MEGLKILGGLIMTVLLLQTCVMINSSINVDYKKELDIRNQKNKLPDTLLIDTVGVIK